MRFFFYSITSLMTQSRYHYQVTLIQAPAGFGKTTLVGQWVALHQATPQFPAVAWVSLGEEDNDPVQFWRYLITACQSFQPDLGQTSLALLAHVQQPSIIDMLTLWLNELDHLPQKGLLILDDYHVINEPDIHVAITYEWNGPGSCQSLLTKGGSVGQIPGRRGTQRTKDTMPETVLGYAVQQVPTRRFAEPEDVAVLIVFLASGRNQHINGEAIRVSGGA